MLHALPIPGYRAPTSIADRITVVAAAGYL
jgi:hypothetical protein